MANSEANRIQPYAKNPRYWQYKGKPLMLIGGSDEDNLFNHPDLPPNGLEAHLDLLLSVGGNYVRNTMSCRDEGNIWPFYQDPKTQLYDLDRPSEAFWDLFRRFLEMTAERDIIVQIEVWDRFDFAREPWDVNPFNPKNNSTYTREESGLPHEILTHPGRKENPFFRSVPELEDNALVRKYQDAVVERMLSISLSFPNVLYCVSNETSESPLWGEYWAKFIRRSAAQAGVGVELTEMWDARDLENNEHKNTYEHPELYSFVDISQNNHQLGEVHWENMQRFLRRITPPRPVNSVKIYGGHPHGGGLEEGTHKLWRNILGGLATARFHRPASGPGLSELAQVHLKSARMLLDAFDVIRAQPANHLLYERVANEAFCMAIPGEAFAVYFPNPGAVKLDAGAPLGTVTTRWLDIVGNRWQEPYEEARTDRLTLATPGGGQWVALVRPN